MSGLKANFKLNYNKFSNLKKLLNTPDGEIKGDLKEFNKKKLKFWLRNSEDLKVFKSNTVSALRVSELFIELNTLLLKSNESKLFRKFLVSRSMA